LRAQIARAVPAFRPGVWCCAALLLTWLPLTNSVSLGIALLALVLAPKLFPRISTPILTAALPKWELPLRMLAGAAITLAVTSLAAVIGPSWSGMFAVFPVITIVLSMFSHRASGPAFTVTLLRAMIWGLYALASFASHWPYCCRDKAWRSRSLPQSRPPLRFSGRSSHACTAVRLPASRAHPLGRVQVSDHARQQLDPGLPKRSCGNTFAEATLLFTESCALRAGRKVL